MRVVEPRHQGGKALPVQRVKAGWARNAPRCGLRRDPKPTQRLSEVLGKCVHVLGAAIKQRNRARQLEWVTGDLTGKFKDDLPADATGERHPLKGGFLAHVGHSPFQADRGRSQRDWQRTGSSSIHLGLVFRKRFCSIKRHQLMKGVGEETPSVGAMSAHRTN